MIESDGMVTLYDQDTRFSFLGFRRLNRYLYPNGLQCKKNSMRNKYCIEGCAIDPGDIVVEIGANVGEFTLMACQTAGQVYSFEPDPLVFACLKKNTAECKNVEILPYGASNNSSTQVFYLASEDADSSFIKPKIYNKAVEIDTIRLDEWIESVGLSGIDFLKLEAEGAEMEVLEGLGEKISIVKKISVDGGPERYGEPTYEQVNKHLISNGFNTRVSGYHVYGWRSLE
jgi:FkbM family methyltransferase